MKEKKKNPNYVNNKDFHDALITHKRRLEE